MAESPPMRAGSTVSGLTLHLEKVPRAVSARHLVCVLVLALIVRCGLCVQPHCIDRNGVILVRFARQLADDPFQAAKTTLKQPGFSLLLLATHKCFGDWLDGDTPEGWQRSGQCLAVLGGTLTCAGVYLVSRRLFDSRIAFIAGIFSAVWPQGSRLSAGVLSDMPHLGLYLFALCMAHRAISLGSIARLILCGVLTGAAYLIRQEAAGLVLAVVACLVATYRERRPAVTWFGLLGFLAAFAIVSSLHAVLAGALFPNKSPADLLELLSRGDSAPGALSLAYTVPGWKMPGRMIGDWAKSGAFVFSTLFLVCLFLRVVPRAESSARRLVVFAALAHVALVLLRGGVYGELSIRYAVIPAALCLPWAAAAFSTLVSGVGQKIHDPSPGRVAAVWLSACILAFTPLIYAVSRPINAQKAHYLDAAAWLRRNSRPTGRIIAHRNLEQLMFHADRIHPSQTWIKIRRSHHAAQMSALLEQYEPAFYLDVEHSHRGELDEVSHWEMLLGGGVPRLEPAYDSGDQEFRVRIFRIRPAATSGPAPG